MLAQALEQLVGHVMRQRARALRQLERRLFSRCEKLAGSELAQRLDLLWGRPRLAATGSIDVYSKRATDETGNAHVHQEAQLIGNQTTFGDGLTEPLGRDSHCRSIGRDAG